MRMTAPPIQARDNQEREEGRPRVPARTGDALPRTASVTPHLLTRGGQGRCAEDHTAVIVSALLARRWERLKADMPASPTRVP